MTERLNGSNYSIVVRVIEIEITVVAFPEESEREEEEETFTTGVQTDIVSLSDEHVVSVPLWLIVCACVLCVVCFFGVGVCVGRRTRKGVGDEGSEVGREDVVGMVNDRECLKKSSRLTDRRKATSVFSKVE